MTTVLYNDEWVTVTFDVAAGLFRYVRSAQPYGDASNMERSYSAVGQVAQRIPPGVKLLLDMRQAPPRNDEAFEAKVDSVFNQFAARFAKHATLVRTAAGKLQSLRMATARGGTPHVFDDEAAALAYLGVSADPKVR